MDDLQLLLVALPFLLVGGYSLGRVHGRDSKRERLKDLLESAERDRFGDATEQGDGA